jgi:UDPglucose 6-dehydrogenase
VHLFLVGAGHVGLATATGLVRLGHRVTVSDIDADRIARLQSGRPPLFEPGLGEAVASGLAAGRLAFTTEPDPPGDARFTFVCVSTPTGPDGPLSTAHVEAVVGRLLDAVPADHTIVVRSTLPIDGPARLRAIAAGRAIRPAIVTNPEFMREGQALLDFDRPNRVVAGWVEPADREAASAVLDLYAPLGAPTLAADADSVALVKLLSNVFLAMKVAFANEVARVADTVGADADTVIQGVGLDPRIGTAFMKPGPGFGGSCLPEQAVAIALQTAALHLDTPLLSAIHRSNVLHQRQIVARLEQLLGGDGSLLNRRIALLGLAFKASTDDVRESPALALAAHLRQAGAVVCGYDPRAEERARLADPALQTSPSVLEAVDGADAVLVATEWAEFGSLDWRAIAGRMTGTLVYDSRDVVDVEAVRAAGLRIERLGAGRPAHGARSIPTG